jgi:hypothetical protein
MATKAAVGLHHPPDDRQQAGDQVCLGHKFIRPSGHRRPRYALSFNGVRVLTYIGFR